MTMQPLELLRSKEKVQEALNRWSQEGFFRLKGLGDRIRIEKIVSCSAYTIMLKTQYEERIVTRGIEPYYGGEVDDTGIPPDPYSIVIAPPANFEKRDEEIRIPHTEGVETCSECSGSGHTRCNFCFGSGQTTCSWCGGSGSRSQSRTVTTTNSDGTTSSSTEWYQESCSCFGGKVSCGSCMGSGQHTCSRCQGQGRIRSFDLLTALFRFIKLEDVLDATDMPDALLGKVSGEVLIDEREERLSKSARVSDEVDVRANRLLSKSQNIPNTRIVLHFQRLHIEQVGIYEATYRYKEHPEQRLWVYGAEGKVYAPNAPKSWGRILLFALGVLALLGVIGYLVFQSQRY